MEIRRTYKYRMYRTGRRNKRLHNQIDIAGMIWNHSLALQRRYYRLCGGYISEKRLKKHIAKLRREVRRYAYWKLLGSQSVQDVIERLDKSYTMFFKKKGGRPRFRKVKRYSSFMLKQAGWAFKESHRADIGKIRIGKYTHKFVKHREIQGEIKTITVKRDRIGRMWICFSVIENLPHPVKVSTGKIGGFDFGLKTFLTDDQGRPYMNPQFFNKNLNKIAKLNRALSRKSKGSRNRERTRRKLSREHIRIADKRRDFHYYLAHKLCDEYKMMFFEDLNLDGMKRLWGRKVSDLGFNQFMEILVHMGFLVGSFPNFIGRFYPSSKTCSECGHIQDMPLKERVFNCEECGLSIDRDHNAARNIVWSGASAQGLEIVSRSTGLYLSERHLV
jgi:putative transposase